MLQLRNVKEELVTLLNTYNMCNDKFDNWVKDNQYLLIGIGVVLAVILLTLAP